MDSRTSSILLNLDLDIDITNYSNKYIESKKEISDSENSERTKVYNNLRSTIKECYLTGSLKYGNNFIM